MYTLEDLQSKTFKELKGIGKELNVFPAGDRRFRQNWIDAIAGVNPPLLALLEVFPAAEVEVELVEEAIVRATKISVYLADFDPISDIDENREVYYQLYGVEQSEADYDFRVGLLSSRGDSDRLEVELELSQSAIAPALPISPGVIGKILPVSELSPGVEVELVVDAITPAVETPPGVTFSSRFLVLYSPPQPEIHYKVDIDGQLSLLDFEMELVHEPPDPDDFDCLDDFREAMAAWDAENSEPFAVSLDSFCEWAPCPLDWYEPSELEVMELSPPIFFEGCANASSDTSNFFIPVFGVAGDRTNGNDEPPTAGVGARLPKPKPPSFPSVSTESRCPCGAMPAAQCDGTTATHIYPDRIVFTPCYKQLDTIGARSPPGGDAMQ